MQALGPGRIQSLPAEVKPDYEQALLDLNIRALKCPRTKVHERNLDLSDPIIALVKNICRDISKLKNKGYGAYTTLAEKEVIRMGERIRIARGLGSLQQTTWNFVLEPIDKVRSQALTSRSARRRSRFLPLQMEQVELFVA
jgi:hypothetical protein